VSGVPTNQTVSEFPDCPSTAVLNELAAYESFALHTRQCGGAIGYLFFLWARFIKNISVEGERVDVAAKCNYENCGIVTPVSKIKSDIYARLRAANQDISESRSLKWFRVVMNRSTDHACHACMADPGSARPSDRDVASFRQFEQTIESAIPFDGDPASCERNLGPRSRKPLGRVRRVTNLFHARRNSLNRAKNFRMYALGLHTPIT
jgi:hypothetical protein